MVATGKRRLRPAQRRAQGAVQVGLALSRVDSEGADTEPVRRHLGIGGQAGRCPDPGHEPDQPPLTPHSNPTA
jgi:hypothetical protein